jgi:hypothetical protein
MLGRAPWREALPDTSNIDREFARCPDNSLLSSYHSPMNPTQPIRPLNIGNVVSAGFRLFNDNRKSYLLVALRAVLWSTLFLVALVAAIGLIVGGSLSLAANSSAGGDPALGGLLLVVGFVLMLLSIPLAFFCSAKAIYNETLIAANAYGHLTNQPELMPQTHQRLKRKTWTFWVVRFLVGLLIGVSSVPFSILQQFVPAFGTLARDSQAMGAIIGLIFVVIVVLQYGVQFWLSIRLLLPEMVLAIEEEVQNTSSIPRSWNLTQGNTIRIGMILLVAFLVTCPLYALTIIPAIILAVALLPASLWSGLAASSSAAAPPIGLVIQMFVGLAIVFLVYMVLALFVQILVIPFWQTIKAAIYYDLRSRREGMGLSLDDR